MRRPRGTAAMAGALTLLFVAAVAIVLLAPLIPAPESGSSARLDQVTPLTQLTAFRPQVGAASAGLGSVVAMVAAALLLRRGATAPRLVALGGGVLVVAVAGGPTLDLARMASSDPGSGLQASRDASTLTVVSANTRGTAGSPTALAAVVRRTGASVVALPEGTPLTAARVRAALPGGQDGWLAVTRRNPGPDTSIVVRRELRPIPRLRDVGQSNALASADVQYDGRLLELYVAHTTAPRRGATGQWAADLRAFRRLCSRPAVVMGDLNATADHSLFAATAEAGCRPAAARSRGTWPSSQPTWLRAQVDHVLLPGPLRTVASGTAPLPGSDHDLVWATLRWR